MIGDYIRRQNCFNEKFSAHTHLPAQSPILAKLFFYLHADSNANVPKMKMATRGAKTKSERNEKKKKRERNAFARCNDYIEANTIRQ